MWYKILDKYSKLKTEHKEWQGKENIKISENDEKIISNFLKWYDKDVKQIHQNEEQIEKDLQCWYSESHNLTTICNQAFTMYDKLVEYFKEAGDWYNFCTILETEVNNVQLQIANANPKESTKANTVNNNSEKKE